MIPEYLTSEVSFRALGQLHGIDYQMIHQWVQRYKSKMKIKPNKPPKVKPTIDSDDLPTDVKQLLHNYFTKCVQVIRDCYIPFLKFMLDFTSK